ncbi:MAG: hypothetical protein QOH01_701 [Verrucomicrobiota bacterium]|jgi:hypothetical protein
MINTTIKYIVYTHTGGGVRHHHFGTQNNIIDEADGHASTGDLINALGFASLPFNGATLPFAFMSVHGAADGNHLYTSPGNQEVQVGADNIDILVVYAPPGGIGGNGGPGVWVDAFNVDTGNFSDSLDFIKVLTPPTPPDTEDAAKTSFGNSDGGVPTTTAENVRANSRIDGAVPFVEWKKIIPTPTIQAGADIHLTKGETGEIWFAFYQTPTPPSFTLPRVIEAMSSGIFIWTGDDTCGNGGHWIFPHGGGPGPGPGQFRISVGKNVLSKLSAEQKRKLDAFASEYPAIAEAGLNAITKVLESIQTLSNILGKANR